jgi:hypothetical protein
MIIEVHESAAASAVGTDLLDGHRGQQSGRMRVIKFAGLVGSAAEGDAAVDLYYGDVYVGTIYNSSEGANIAVKADADLKPVGGGLICPANTPIHALVTDAGATNILALTLVTHEF